MSAAATAAPLLEDPDLLGLVVEGNAAAFDALFHRYYPAIHAFAYRLALCPAEADDIAQDTFVQAARSIASFRGDASLKNWLYTIATNKSRDRRRQHVRRVLLGEELARLTDIESTSFHSTTERAAHAAVREALAGLSFDLREAIALVYYEGLNHAEAARILCCAESTVSWRVFRAKHKLKKALCPSVASARHD